MRKIYKRGNENKFNLKDIICITSLKLNLGKICVPRGTFEVQLAKNEFDDNVNIPSLQLYLKIHPQNVNI